MDSESKNIKKWNVIYPVYLNSKKTIAEGRRISAAKACENPNCVEIDYCCKHYLNIPSVPEFDKAYPRDFMLVGRVRVQLKREDGSFWNPAITSKKALMIQIAELVPKHRAKTQKAEPVSTSGAGSKPGKGGKKKR